MTSLELMLAANVVDSNEERLLAWRTATITTALIVVSHICEVGRREGGRSVVKQIS